MNLSVMSASDAPQKAASGLMAMHRNYLAKRGILRAAMRIGVQTITGRLGEPLICYPYARGFYKTYDLGSDSPWRQVKTPNSRLPLFLLERADFSKPWILTEGENDALASLEVGESNVVSLPDGAVGPGEETPAKSGKLWAIRDAFPRIQAGGGQVTLALDNDAAGDATRDALIDIFGRWRCRLIDWPEHSMATGNDGRCKDLNEVLELFGPERTREVIRSARPIKLEGVFKPSDIKRRPPRVYYSTGLPGMDDHLMLFRGELCVWTGHTSHGKSTALMSVLCHLAEQGLRIGLAAFEADYHEDILPFVNSWLHGEQANAETEKAAHIWFDERFVLISHEIEPLQAPATAEWLIQQAQDAKGRFSIDVLVVEPWNKLQHKRRPYENETEYIGRALSEFRNYAQAYNAIVIVVAHPDKESGKEGRIPGEFDVNGSAHWGNASDHVVIIYRPDKALTSTFINVCKSRFKKGGKVGGKWFVFSETTNRYSPHAEHLVPKEEKPKRKRVA